MNWNAVAFTWPFWRRRRVTTTTLHPLPRCDETQFEKLASTSTIPAAMSVFPNERSQHFKPFVLSYLGLCL